MLVYWQKLQYTNNVFAETDPPSKVFTLLKRFRRHHYPRATPGHLCYSLADSQLKPRDSCNEFATVFNIFTFS